MSILQRLRPAAKAVSVRSIVLIGAMGLCPLLVPAVGVAADEPMVNEKFADLEPGIQMMRAEIGKDRRDVVKAAMYLTDTEAKVFWPIYDKYRAEQAKVNDKRVKLISDYLANQNGMSQDQAEDIMKDAIKIEEERIEVKKDYIKKMGKELSKRTTARFFHIDYKLDTVVDAALAARIPLIH
jgi:hypothetical protein